MITDTTTLLHVSPESDVLQAELPVLDVGCDRQGQGIPEHERTVLPRERGHGGSSMKRPASIDRK